MTTNNDGTDGDVKIYGRAVDERDSAGYVRFGDREEALTWDAELGLRRLPPPG